QTAPRSHTECRPMATSDLDVEQLISELSASLTPPQRYAFLAAARAALAAAGCLGCGAAYRLLVPLQRSFWDPPDDRQANPGAPVRAPLSRKSTQAPVSHWRLRSARRRPRSQSAPGGVIRCRIGPWPALSRTESGWRCIAWAWRVLRRTYRAYASVACPTAA